MVKKERPVFKLPDVLYNSIVRRFEILSGREFASKIIKFSAYKAIMQMLDEVGESPNHFMHKTIREMTGGKIIHFNLKKNRGGVIRIEDSLEAKSHGPAEYSVCWMTEGIIKACAEKVLGEPVEVLERKCTALGDDYCEFAVIVEAVPLTEEILRTRGVIPTKKRLTEEEIK